ncbi:unnamed protein product [Brachionus calyciflorus]|uniref:Uncharacterized protein n=1 Tax=Brachionus calyciflorus TaxID=104777 RepID=A0A814J8P2_9BILA|nr:unnamed protein product [Brachionus calyciflorus]
MNENDCQNFRNSKELQNEKNLSVRQSSSTPNLVNHSAHSSNRFQACPIINQQNDSQNFNFNSASKNQLNLSHKVCNSLDKSKELNMPSENDICQESFCQIDKFDSESQTKSSSCVDKISPKIALNSKSRISIEKLNKIANINSDNQKKKTKRNKTNVLSSERITRSNAKKMKKGSQDFIYIVSNESFISNRLNKRDTLKKDYVVFLTTRKGDHIHNQSNDKPKQFRGEQQVELHQKINNEFCGSSKKCFTKYSDLTIEEDEDAELQDISYEENFCFEANDSDNSPCESERLLVIYYR